MSISGAIKLEYLKFTPGPKGPSEYPDNKDGFDLYAAPTDTVTNQGGNIGSSFNEVVFMIKGGSDVYETLFGCTAGNNVKTTSATYKSMLIFNNDRKVRNERTYKEITFKSAVEGPEGGEFAGSVLLTCHYTHVKRAAKGYGKGGKAKPTVNTTIDLNQGKITAS
jgi:hypothetical protein